MTTTTALSMPQCAWPSGGVSDLSKLAHECRPPALVGSKLDDKVTNNILPTPNLRGHCRVPIGGRLSLSLSLRACVCLRCMCPAHAASVYPHRMRALYMCQHRMRALYMCPAHCTRSKRPRA